MGVLQRKQVNACGAERWVTLPGECQVECQPQPVTPVIVASATSICGTQTATLSAQGTTPVTWYRDNSPTGDTALSIIVTLPGVYTAKQITVCGASSASNAITIAYSPVCVCTPQPLRPTITASATSICGAQTATLTAANANGTVQWYRDSVAVSGLVGTSVSVNVSGIYTAKSITLCGESIASLPIVIDYSANCGCFPEPIVPVITASAASVCPGDLVTLTATGGCQGTVQWFSSAQPSVVIGTGATLMVSVGTYTARCGTVCGTGAMSASITITTAENCGGGGGCSFSISTSTISC